MNSLVQINPPAASGKKYWRSLDHLAGTPEFRQWVEREFQDGASDWMDRGSRRSLLKLMAASFGLAGLTACRRPVEHILPHSKGVEDYVHGKPLHYATVAQIGGAATGLIVECNDGRPTKVEGNPRHPYSLGATSAFLQASVLSLYDPDRAKTPQRAGKPATWDEFAAFARQHFTPAKLGAGDGLRILAERSSSPSLAAQRAALLKKFPAARWIEYDSVSFDAARLGAEMAFGQALEPHYQFDKADIVVSLDADFLGLDSPTTQPVTQFSSRRRVADAASASMNRLYVAEPNFSITGAVCDHRLRLRGSEVATVAMQLAKAAGVAVDAPAASKWLTAAAADLLAHKGKSIVLAGPRQPAPVHALVALINQALGNLGQTVVYTRPAVAASDSLAEVKQLAADLSAGKVNTLVCLGGNPAYTLPADCDFAANAKKAQVSIALAAEENETWAAAEWGLPESHAFEAWGDARALDGTLSVQQPLIEPLYQSRSALELAALIAGSAELKGYDLVRSVWAADAPAAERDKRWKQALFEGVAGAKAAPVSVSADLKKTLAAMGQPPTAASGIEVGFYPSWSAYDGRFSNNAWMQEAPDPLTKLVWDNAALLSVKTAQELGVVNGDMIEVTAQGKAAVFPAMILPGHADNAVSLSLGYGRARVGRVGQGVGHSAAPLRTTAGFHYSAAQVRKTGAKYQLVTTQEHHTMEEPITHEMRHPVIEGTLEHFKEHPDFAAHVVHTPPLISMFPAFDYSKGNQWGMVIDLNTCIGCNACLVACQAENNIPVVGKDQVRRGREMHWIRMDRYFTGHGDDVEVVTQPVACVQCENAPCESVCPVAATAHSPEGLNEMAYNRCVGTRYCANNCPYKVRRFNFLNWNKNLPETTKMVFNPDVTVRMRGVMEKCNYCVQRIQEKKIQAKAEGRRPLKDGEVITACQQVCPAGSIVFGNINDPESKVSKARKHQLDYELIPEVNTKARTSYLAKLRNPKAELSEKHG